MRQALRTGTAAHLVQPQTLLHRGKAESAVPPVDAGLHRREGLKSKKGNGLSGLAAGTLDSRASHTQHE